MLVLTRRQEESIIIFCGDKKIELQITDLNFNTVKIAFEADTDVKIYRKELVENNPNGFLKELTA
jgi:carbon storage regulator CsrA